MRLISKLFFVFVIVSSCKSQKINDFKTASITYTYHSRGIFQSVEVINAKVLVRNNRNEKPHEITISEKELKELEKAFSELDLEKIPALKAPTAKRLYDGAAIANLNITSSGKEYASKSFDQGFPPSAIEKIVKILGSYTDK